VSARGKEGSIASGLGGFVSPLCPLSSCGVGFLRNLIGRPAPSVAPSVSFPSSLALPCFARQAAGQGSCSQVDFGSGVTVPVEEIIVTQSGIGLCKGRSLRDRGYPKNCIGSSLFLIRPRRGDIVPGASRRSLLLFLYSPCLATGDVIYSVSLWFYRYPLDMAVPK